MITVALVVRNEEGYIKTCLESVKWADEIILVDNGSTDKTIDIAKKYTSKIFSLKVSDFSASRNFAAQKALGDWILFVDADERVLLPLKEEITSLVGQNSFSAYALPRKNVIFGHLEKYGPFWPDWVVRLIRKKDFIEYIGKVHEYPKFEGKLGYCKSSLLHLTHRGLDQVVLKSLEYSKIDSKLRFESKHPRMSGWRFLRILITELFNQGVIRRGFFNGSIGTMDALLQSFSLLMSYIRLWELQQSEPREKVYKKIDEQLEKNNFVISLL